MIRNYQTIDGQSIIDVVLNTYGTINELPRLINDNGVNDLNQLMVTGQSFSFDSDFIQDEGMFAFAVQNGIILITGTGLPADYILIENTDILATEQVNNFIK